MWAVSYVASARRAAHWKPTFAAQLRGRRGDRRRLTLPRAAELRRLHRVYSLRQLGIMLGCSYTTISNRINAS